MIIGHDFTVHRLMMADRWGDLLFGQGSALSALLMAAAYLFLILNWVLCEVTAWGMKRNKGWSQATGMIVCVLFLPWFPVLTIIGAAGLYFLRATPASASAPATGAVDLAALAAAKHSQDYWTRKRQSWLQPVVVGVFTLIGLNCLGLFGYWAKRSGMPHHRWGLEFWLWFSVFLLVQTAIHELGHACMAWAVYSRVKVISIGPVTISLEEKGMRWAFDWRLLFHSGGYMGAVVTSETNVRAKQIATVAAGPAASILNGLVFLAVFFSAPGTPLQDYWWLISTNAMLGILYGVSNLIPVGYSDGSMLFHLIFNTAPGRILLFGYVADLKRQAATEAHDRTDFDTTVAVKRETLAKALEGGPQNAMAIAACHQTLGHALLSTDEWHAAEAEFRACLAFEIECTANQALAANAWLGLQKACTERHKVAEAGKAYATSVRVLSARKQDREPMARAVTSAMLAQCHLWAASFEASLQEISEALGAMPANPTRLVLTAMMQSAKVKAELRLGKTEEGMAALRAMLQTIESPEMPKSQQLMAWSELAGVAKRLWEAGQPEAGVEQMRVAIDRLEAGGAIATAASYRIRLAGMLRQLGRTGEAASGLPDHQSLPARLQRAALTERAQLALTFGRPQDAVTDCRRVVELWRAETVECAIEVAIAEGLLARALFESGDTGAGEGLAIKSAEVLGPMRHPDVAGCVITLALAREATAEVVAEARALIEGSLLLGPAQKARMLEAEMTRLETIERVKAAVV